MEQYFQKKSLNLPSNNLGSSNPPSNHLSSSNPPSNNPASSNPPSNNLASSNQPSNNPPTELDEILANLPADPGLRPPMTYYNPNFREQIRRAYLQRGPCQPTSQNDMPQTLMGESNRRFLVKSSGILCPLFCTSTTTSSCSHGKGEQQQKDIMKALEIDDLETGQGFKSRDYSQTCLNGLLMMSTKALQKKDQDIVNAMMLVQRCKQKLQSMRDDDFDDLLGKVSIFCGNNDIDVPNMDDLFVPQGRSRRKAQKITNRLYYHVDLFLTIIDKKLVELNNRFTESSTEFSSLKGITDLAEKLVNTGRSRIYNYVYLLLTLALVLPVATASVERAFSAMNIVKTPLRNKIGNQWLSDSLVVYIEKDLLAFENCTSAEKFLDPPLSTWRFDHTTQNYSLALVLKPNIGLLPIVLLKFDGLVTCFVNLAFPFALPPCIYVDNLSALYMAANPIFHARTRHIEIDYHFVRELVARKALRTSYVPSSH
ncbi:unnamed protein product [Prunus armeniaca]